MTQTVTASPIEKQPSLPLDQILGPKPPKPPLPVSRADASKVMTIIVTLRQLQDFDNLTEGQRKVLDDLETQYRLIYWRMK